MPSVNKCIFVGNLGSDPEMRFTPSGAPVTTFSIAVNREWSDTNGEAKKETEWVNVVTWNKQAESCNKFLTKGSLAYIEGRLHTRSWDGQDGQKHYRTEVIANQVVFLSSKKQVDNAPEITDHIEAEDIPF